MRFAKYATLFLQDILLMDLRKNIQKRVLKREHGKFTSCIIEALIKIVPFPDVFQENKSIVLRTHS